MSWNAPLVEIESNALIAAQPDFWDRIFVRGQMDLHDPLPIPPHRRRRARWRRWRLRAAHRGPVHLDRWRGPVGGRQGSALGSGKRPRHPGSALVLLGLPTFFAITARSAALTGLIG